jgi:hypothetical protein
MGSTTAPPPCWLPLPAVTGPPLAPLPLAPPLPPLPPLALLPLAGGAVSLSGTTTTGG